MKNDVRNTAADAAAAPMIGLFHASTPGSIEAQEARGQREVVTSDVLPVDLGGQEDTFRALGFVLGDRVPGDDLFRFATLPPGWTKRRTDHSMWSEIVDGDGRPRVSIFYKAAFYDRRASAGALSRYTTDVPVDNDEGRVVMDRKTGATVFDPGPVGTGAAAEACRAWLAARPKLTLAEEWLAP